MNRFLILVLSVLALVGCNVQGEHPLGEPGVIATGEPLIGSWHRREGERQTFVHVGRGRSAGRLRLVVVLMAAESVGFSATFDAVPTSIGERHYLSLRLDAEPEPDQPWYFVGYEAAGDRLTLSDANVAAFREAILAGRLAGRASPPGRGTAAEITADTDALRAFVAQEPALFRTPDLPLERIKL